MSALSASSRRLRRIAAGAAVVALFGSVLALGAAGPASAAGTVLLNETFSGTSVSDPRAIGLNDACLTAAAAGSSPPVGASNLRNCSTHQSGTIPPIGVSPGWLQLTDVAQGRTGGMVFNRALPSSAGIQVEFDQAQYGGSAADGIGFFLSDGSRSLSTTGASGGSLGYGQNATTPGVAGGYLGIGLDAFGNFIGDFGGLGGGCATPSPFPSRVSNTVTLRGPGDGLVGYCLLTSTANPPTGPSTLPGSLRVASPPSADAAVRNVRLTVSSDPFPLVTVQIDFTGTRTAYQTVLTYRMPAEAPATYKFGFSASTGGNTDVHLIRNVAISTIDPLGTINLVKQVDRTTAQPASYGFGQTIPYQFVVTNAGAGALTGIVVTDPLVTSISCPSTTLGPAGGPTSSMVCTGSHVVTAAESLQPTLTNTATATASAGTLTDTSSATVPITVSQPRLSLVKSAHLNDTNGDGLASVGETINYTFVATNTGNVPLTAVAVTDPRAGAVTCTPTALAVGASANCAAVAPYTVTEADVLAGGIVNTATGAASPPPGIPPIVPPTDTVTTATTIPVAGMAITKTAALNDTNGNGLADEGETISYSFLVRNTGSVSLTGVTVTDPRAGTVTCPSTTLAVGASETCAATAPYTVTLADVLAGGIPNTATGHGTPPAGVPALTPPTDTVTTPTVPVSAALSLQKTATLDDANGNGVADPGETIAYTFALTNAGNMPLSAVGITDPKAGPVTCVATTLAPGASTTCAAVVPYTVTEADVLAHGVTNAATGTATPPPGVPFTPPTDTVTTPTPPAVGGLAMRKSATLNDTNGNGLADIGETIDYSFLLTNTGNVTLTGVGVSDPKAGAVTCPTTTLAPGDATTCTSAPYTVTEADELAGGVQNVASGAATPPAGVPAITPPTDTVTTPTPPPVGGLAMRKSASLNDTNGNGLADIGETIDYSFLLTNTGNVTLTGVGVSDPKAGAVTCPATILAPGDTTTCTADTPYTVTEADELAGGVQNAATGDATPPAGVPAIAPPTDTVIVPTPIPGAGLSLRKTDALNDTNGNGLADAGETIDYSFVLTNTGNVTLDGVGVDDSKAGPVTCPSTTLAIGATETCTADSPYTVTEQDILDNGVVNLATGVSTPPPNVDLIPPTDTITTPTPAPGAGLSLRKSDTLNDTNGNGLADIGETVDYAFVLTNTGNVTLTGVGVDDAKAGAVTCPATTLAPGESTTCTADSPYTVTEQDILDNGVVNLASGVATPPAGVELTPPTDTITTPTPAAGAGLSLVKTATLDDANGNGLADLGETVAFSVTLTNTGNVTLTGVGVSDPTAGAIDCPSSILAPGATMDCTAAAAYTVTEADLLRGAVVNTATGTGTVPDGVPALVPPTGRASIPTVSPTARLAIVKHAALNDTDGSGLADPGETIDYSFTVTNTGDMTITGIAVTDPKAGAVTCPVTTLAPGDETVCTADAPYTVLTADVEAGGVTNVATVTGTPPPGGPTLTPASDTITVSTVPPTAELTLVKSAHLDDTNGDGLAGFGETIDYSFLLTNIGNVTLLGVGVTDPKVGPVTCPTTTLAPQESVTCTARYTGTEQDVIADAVVNTATGHATVPPGIPVSPIDPPTDTVTTPTELAVPGLEVTKSAQLHDADRNHFADVGETIDYTIRLVNTGNLTLSNLAIDDPSAGIATCPASTLAPGATMICTLPPYTVTEADVRQGDTLNVATVTADVPPGAPPLLPVMATVSVAAPPITFPPVPEPGGGSVPGTLPDTGSGVRVLATALIAGGALIAGSVIVRWRRRTRSAVPPADAA